MLNSAAIGAIVALSPSSAVMKPSIPSRCRPSRAFSLVELLTVIAVIAVMTAASGPALQALKSSGGVNKAITETSRTLEYARIYAMSTHTYVRVGIGQTAISGGNLTPATVLIAIYSVDGTLDADTTTSMTDSTKWRPLMKPVIMDNLTVSNSLSVTKTLDSSDYTSPDQTDIPHPVTFKAGDRGSVSCNAFIQFNPNGEARVVRGEPARFIDLGVDKPGSQSGTNPFLIRMSGLNGNISILRKGEGIQ
ncbi:MAG: hypothetical protein B9S32_08190 [Verrucomicrobia bacterium Tous-C9LFEB]|nr:MAG: hypothetical protein B9S32_08190 [Verrucomicrobia bacterium Tous-C9LFEB]